MLSSRSYLILGHDRPFLFYMTVYHFHDKLRTQWLYVWVYLSKTWLLCYKNCRVSRFDFKAINYLLLYGKEKCLTYPFFKKDLSIYIYPYTELLYSVSQNIRYHLLCIHDDLYSLQKWPRSSKPFSWKWNWSYCYVPRRDTNVC